MMDTIAERLKSAREEAGLSQPELAKFANVSQGTIGNVEASCCQALNGRFCADEMAGHHHHGATLLALTRLGNSPKKALRPAKRHHSVAAAYFNGHIEVLSHLC